MPVTIPTLVDHPNAVAAFFVLIVTSISFFGCDMPERSDTNGETAVTQSAETEDELAYLIEVSERLAPDEIQVDREMEAWIARLNEENLAELSRTYERAAAAGHMESITRELQDDPPSDKWRVRRLRRLMSLFDHLGGRGIEPFDSFRVGLRAIPEPSVDWSPLPEDLRWVIGPAEKYGSLRFESRIINYIEQMDETERAEARRLRARFSADMERLQEVGADEPLKPDTPADYIYNLSMFFAYVHMDETGDLPGLDDWARWAKEWEQFSKEPDGVDGQPN